MKHWGRNVKHLILLPFCDFYSIIIFYLADVFTLMPSSYIIYHQPQLFAIFMHKPIYEALGTEYKALNIIAFLRLLQYNYILFSGFGPINDVKLYYISSASVVCDF